VIATCSGFPFDREAASLHTHRFLTAETPAVETIVLIRFFHANNSAFEARPTPPKGQRYA